MLSTEQLQALVIEALEDVKATDIRILDLRGRSGFTDVMIIASGNTDRQVKALAANVVTRAKQNGVRPLGVEGERQGDWVLVDLGEIVVHVMLPKVRDFYNMEKLWGEESPKQQQE